MNDRALKYDKCIMKNNEDMNPVEQTDNADAPFIARKQFTEARQHHWNEISAERDLKFFSRNYHQIIERVYKNIIPEGVRILEIGCHHGDLLNILKPSYGLGIDFSERIIKQAKAKYQGLDFRVADAHELKSVTETFDYIILSDLVNDIFDIQEVFDSIAKICTAQTRIVVNIFNHLWEMPINAARKAGLARSILPQNWLIDDDLKNILRLTGFEVVSAKREILFPVRIPILDHIFNRFLAKIWPFSFLALSHFYVVRKKPEAGVSAPSVSVVVAARNEAGHIREILERLPPIGSSTELIFVEGGSSDGTYEVIRKYLESYTKFPAFLYRQTGKGKGDAIRLGFEKAQNDILMILDADLTVMPEDLPKFYNALLQGKGEFINGVRLVYPMDKRAMRFLNMVGNKFFSKGFSYVLGQPVKDTLCGTKVLYRREYDIIAQHRAYFGDFDPYGDFDLLFGAAKQNLKIIDMPIRYRARTYGETNINRWEGGWLLLRMLIVAMKKLKFI